MVSVKYLDQFTYDNITLIGIMGIKPIARQCLRGDCFSYIQFAFAIDDDFLLYQRSAKPWTTSMDASEEYRA